MKWLSKIVEGEKLVKQTKENINKHIVRGILSLIMLAVILVLILMPFIIDMTYNCPPPIDFFDVELSKSDILDYYAQLLSLLATIVLGVIAVIQTYRSQKKSDEINALQLSIAQRELAVVEKQYETEMENAKALVPRFEIKIDGYSGYYCNISLRIKNVSEMMVSAFRNISFQVYKSSDEVLSITRWKLKFQSIASSESQRVEIYTPDMRDNVGQQGNVAFWENVKFVWKFSCEDCQGNKHFYVASIIIPNTCEYNKDFWEVKKIG